MVKIRFLTAALAATLIAGPTFAEAPKDSAFELFRACAKPEQLEDTVRSQLIQNGWRRVTAMPFDQDMVVDGHWSVGELGYAHFFLSGQTSNLNRLINGRPFELKEAKERLIAQIQENEPLLTRFNPKNGNAVFTKDRSLFSLSSYPQTGHISSCDFFGPMEGSDTPLLFLPVVTSNTEGKHVRVFRVDEKSERPRKGQWQGQSDWNWPFAGYVVNYDQRVLLHVLPEILPTMVTFSMHFAE